MRRRLTILALELWLPALVVAGWWIYSVRRPATFFPALPDILAAFRDNWLFAHIASDAVPSLLNLTAGLAIATAVGVGAGIALGLAPAARRALWPVLEFLRAVPGIALIPLALLLLGIGPSTKIAVIAYGTLWPILLNTIDGVRGVDPTVHQVARAFRIRRRDVLTRVVLPAASPQIVAGMRTSLALGVSLIAFAEMVASTDGIGYFTLQAQRTFAVADMWSGMLFLGLAGYVLNVAFRGFERRVLSWHRGMGEAR